METVDELMTPGCPQCAYKHLSAALSYLADRCDTLCAEHEILLARAKVNLVECRMGYHRHFPFAVGLMERAETVAVATGYQDAAASIRDLRVRLIRDGESAIPYAVSSMSGPSGIGNGPMMWAHVIEAARELRFDCPVAVGEDSIVAALDGIRKDFFDLPDEQPEKGGESDMACCKKAACKGGKCAAPAKKAPAKKGKKGCK